MTNPIAAIHVPGGHRYHESVACYAPLHKQGTVSLASDLKLQGRKPCTKCWTGRGYVVSAIPEMWEARQAIAEEREGIKVA